MSIIQGYRGVVKIGTALMPALPGSTISMPKNYNLPQFISGNNIYQLNAVEGLQFPVVSLVLAVTKEWFTAANLRAWSPDVGSGRPGDDIPSIGSLYVWDGANGIQAENCKHADFSIGVSQGELVRCTARFFGGGQVTDYTYAGTEILTSTPAAFQHTGHSGTGRIVSWDLSWSNALMPNPALPVAGHNASDPHPSELNAGLFTARLRLVMQADQDPPADGTALSLYVKPPGTSGAVTFTCNNLLRLDPQERTLQMPRQLREYNYICRGIAGAGSWTPPVQVS